MVLMWVSERYDIETNENTDECTVKGSSSFTNDDCDC